MHRWLVLCGKSIGRMRVSLLRPDTFEEIRAMLARIIAGLGVTLGLFVSAVFGLLSSMLAVSEVGRSFALPTVVLAAVVVLLCALCSYGTLAALSSDSARSPFFLGCAVGVALAVTLYYAALPDVAMADLGWTYWALWFAPAIMFLVAGLLTYRGQRSVAYTERD